MTNVGLGLAFDIAVSIIFFSLLGHFIDDKFSLTPWGIISGVILGTILAFYYLYKFINKKNS